MGTKYSTSFNMAVDENCGMCHQTREIRRLMSADHDFTTPFWTEVCVCGEARHNHSSGHPHCTWVDENATVVEAMCEGFFKKDELHLIKGELQDIEKNLR